MILKKAFLLLASLVVFSSQNVFAAPDFSVAYVDIQKALETSRAGSRAQKKYEKEIKSAQDGLRTKKKELEKKQAAFLKQKSSLNADARAKKQEELISLEKDLKRSLEDAQDNLQRTNSSLISDLVTDLRKIVKEVGKEKGYTIIFERGGTGVLYADNDIDITELVVERFDARKK